MEKIKINGIKKEILHEKLSNGLDVYMVDFKSKNFYISFTSKFGSSYLEFKDEKTNKKVSIKRGVAHFLEHQMFEGKDESAFTSFASLGTIINAYTSLDNTSYLALGDKNFKETLNLVLDFVQSPYFINENVLMEQKIIEEEIKTGEDDYVLLAESTLNYNLFKKDPQKYLITGNSDDVKQINASDLEKAYKVFYNPDNMFLVITGNFHALEALGIIKENQKDKKFFSSKKVNVTKYKEPTGVEKKYEVLNREVNTPVISMGIKISKSAFKEIKEKDLNNLIDAFMFLTFGPSSNLNILLNDENLISENISYSCTLTSNLVCLAITVKSEYINEVIKQIENALTKQKFNARDLERFKRTKISKYVNSLNDLISANDLIVNDLVSGKINTNYIGNINSLSLKSLNKLASFINIDNKSVVVVKNENSDLRK